MYTYTWYVPIFNGIVKRKEMFWVSTEHARDLSITEVREDALVAQARKQLEGLDNLHLLPIGQLLLKATVISNRQLQDALAVQKERGGFLGDILVDTGAIDQSTLEAYLNLQQSVKAAAGELGGQTRRLPLGQVLIGSGLVTQQQIDQALQYQKEHGGLMGEAFVSIGALTPEVVDIFLQFQGMLDVNYVSVDKAHALIAGMARQDYSNVGELLYEGGFISHSQLNAVLQYQQENGGDIEQILVEMGYIDPEALALIMNAQRIRR